MTMEKKYYAAYDERYKTVHEQEFSWFSDQNTPIVMQTVRKYGLNPGMKFLEIGCGEGRDAKTVLENGYDLLATDVSQEAIAYCKNRFPEYTRCFEILDCLENDMEDCFNFIYAVAVVHMLVPDRDRNSFYRFICDHLTKDGLALICTMGDGEEESESDISKAFHLVERDHESGKMLLTATSCRKVSFHTFEKELTGNGLSVVESGITSALPDFDRLMYAVVRRNDVSP